MNVSIPMSTTMDQKLAGKASSSSVVDHAKVDAGGLVSALLALSSCIQALNPPSAASITVASNSIDRTTSTEACPPVKRREVSSQRTASEDNEDNNSSVSNGQQELGKKKRSRNGASPESPLGGRATKKPKLSVEERDAKELHARSQLDLEQDGGSGYDSEPCDEIRKRSHDKVVEYMDSLRGGSNPSGNPSSNSNGGESTFSADDDLTSMDSRCSDDEIGETEESDTSKTSSCSHFSYSTSSSCRSSITSNSGGYRSRSICSCGCSSCSGCDTVKAEMKTACKEKERQLEINVNVVKENRTLCVLVEKICQMVLKSLKGTYESSERNQDQKTFLSLLQVADQQNFSSHLIKDLVLSRQNDDQREWERSSSISQEDQEVNDESDVPPIESRLDVKLLLNVLLDVLKVFTELQTPPDSNSNSNNIVSTIANQEHSQEQYPDSQTNTEHSQVFRILRDAFSQHNCIPNDRLSNWVDTENMNLPQLQQQPNCQQAPDNFFCAPAITQEGQRYLVDTMPDGIDFSLAFQLPKSELASQLQSLLANLINTRGKL